MNRELFEQFIEDYNSADMVVIGIGTQLHKRMINDVEKFTQILHFYCDKLDKKNYFIITTLNDDVLIDMGFNRRRLVRPLMAQESEIEEKQWELYNKWLSATLNKKLMIIELGEDFNHPNVFRWPFEKVIFINQKSYMYRIHDVFYQLPENINSRAMGVQQNAFEFLEELFVLLNKQ